MILVLKPDLLCVLNVQISPKLQLLTQNLLCSSFTIPAFWGVLIQIEDNTSSRSRFFIMLRLSAFLSNLLMLITLRNVAVEAIDIDSIERDLVEFNKTCYEDGCASHPYTDELLSTRPCHCGVQCVLLGICCLDSYYANVPQPQFKRNCVSTYGTTENYFMIDQCPPSSAWSSLCHDDWSGESDLQKLVPVTSLLTGITYKNYFCLRCHEANDEILYWIVKIRTNALPGGTSDDQSQLSSVSLFYAKDEATWMAIYDADIGYFPVNITVLVPPNVNKLLHFCIPGIIPDCPNEWSDEEVRYKCQSYADIKQVNVNDSIKYYKNIHCALCNFESLNDISCPVIPPGFHGFMPLSFTHLLDLNTADGELVGKTQKCPDEELWDPFTRKCRKLTCVLPGFKVKDGKCVEG